jgi:hypothetical protein
MGFPAGSYTGFAFTSIFEVAMPGKSALLFLAFLFYGSNSRRGIIRACSLGNVSNLVITRLTAEQLDNTLLMDKYKYVGGAA